MNKFTSGWSYCDMYHSSLESAFIPEPKHA